MDINDAIVSPNIVESVATNIVKHTLKKKSKKYKLILIDDTLDKSKKILTEDLGKIFEMAICILYKIKYDGKYKYSIEEAETLSKRIVELREIFPYNISHTAKNGSQYDFMDTENDIKLSAKTTKKDGKVCPQVIGQPSKKNFCEYFSLNTDISLQDIKHYIQNNIDDILNIYYKCTFDCPIIYYNKKKNLVYFIKSIREIEWNKQEIEFSHIKKQKIWNESSSISIRNITIGEFQVHNHRDCIKFRWFFENLLKMFNDSFEIITL